MRRRIGRLGIGLWGGRGGRGGRWSVRFRGGGCFGRRMSAGGA